MGMQQVKIGLVIDTLPQDRNCCFVMKFSNTGQAAEDWRRTPSRWREQTRAVCISWRACPDTPKCSIAPSQRFSKSFDPLPKAFRTVPSQKAPTGEAATMSEEEAMTKEDAGRIQPALVRFPSDLDQLALSLEASTRTVLAD
jgi:hypothetical protein